MLQDYTKAVDSYNASLQIIRSQQEAYASRALALRLDGKSPAALESVIDALRVSSTDSRDSQSLHASARYIMRALLPSEFEEAEEAIKDVRGVSVADEHALLISRKEGRTLDEDGIANAERARVALHKALDLEPSDPNVRAEVYANLART